MTSGWSNGDPHDVARTILAEPRFRGITAPATPGPTLLERLLAWIGDRLHDFLRGVGHVLGSANGLSAILTALLTLAVLAGLLVLAVRFARLRGRRHSAAMRTEAKLDGTLTSAQLLAEARRLAREERWHDAASALVRAALLALDETGRLRFDPTRTAAEARRLLRDPGFDTFEREATPALFAAGEATPERFARLRDAYAQTFGVPA